jgi:hypothetical protein
LAAARLVSTLLTTLLLAATRLIATLLATTGRTVILRIASRRLLAAATTATDILATLLHTLISFSVVCHVNPPLLIVVFENFGPSEKTAHASDHTSTFMPKENQGDCA